MRYALLLLLLLALPALAGEAKLNWTAPTTRTDGSALTNLKGFRIYYGQDSQNLSAVLDLADPAKTTHTVTGLTSGLWYFAMTAYDTNNLESAQTNQVTKSVVDAPPNPPGDLAVDPGNLTAYAVVKRRDGFVMVPIGTVAAGTACLADQTVNGYYAVPRASVTPSGSVYPEVSVALCN